MVPVGANPEVPIFIGILHRHILERHRLSNPSAGIFRVVDYARIDQRLRLAGVVLLSGIIHLLILHLLIAGWRSALSAHCRYEKENKRNQGKKDLRKRLHDNTPWLFTYYDEERKYTVARNCIGRRSGRSEQEESSC